MTKEQTLMNEKPIRSLFATKTAVAQYITAFAGVATLVWPPAQAFVAAHAAAVLFAIPLINLAIRRITHGRVQLIADAAEL